MSLKHSFGLASAGHVLTAAGAGILASRSGINVPACIGVSAVTSGIMGATAAAVYIKLAYPGEQEPTSLVPLGIAAASTGSSAAGCAIGVALLATKLIAG